MIWTAASILDAQDDFIICGGGADTSLDSDKLFIPARQLSGEDNRKYKHLASTFDTMSFFQNYYAMSYFLHIFDKLYYVVFWYIFNIIYYVVI